MPEQTEPTVANTAPEFGFATSRSLGAVAEPLLVGLAGLLLASVVAASDGGYFSDSHAWLAFVSLVAVTLRLILVPALPLRRLDWAFVTGMAFFAGWGALSTVWSPAATASLDAALRDGSYASAVLLLVVFVRPRTVEPLLAGTMLGVTLITSYSLVTRLQPDWVGNWDPVELGDAYRLSGPIGYWNALGLYAVMGTLLALVLAARSHSRVVQALAGAAPVVLVPTILLTFSRGAWLGLAAGLLAAIAIDRRRLQLAATGLVLAPWPVAVLALIWSSDNLTDSTITLRQAANEGGTVLVWTVVLAVVSAALAVAFRLAASRVHVTARVRHVFAAVVLAAGVVAAVALLVAYGSPRSLIDRAADSYGGSNDATGRLFDLRSNGRIDMWRVSFDQFEANPLAGEGAGSWEAAWNLQRPYEGIARNAHGLYSEVLGELGLVGLALLVAALAVPLVAAVRARARPLTAGALAAFVAYLTVAAVDWDWQLVGVTLVALIAAAALVVSARGDDESTEPGAAIRIGLPAVTGVLSLLALAAVLATVPLGRAREAYNRLDFDEAASQAQKASDWAPWSSEALDILGRAQLAQGKVAKARLSFRSAVEKTPNDWELWRDLAAASPPASARPAIRRALALNPLETELKQFQEALRSGNG